MEESSISPLHDPVFMRVVLERKLGRGDGAGLRVRECRIANTRRRDGSRGTVAYEVMLEDPASGRIWEERISGISFGGNRTQRVWESVQPKLASGAYPLSVTSLPAFAYVPELDLLLQVFPHDIRLPALAALMTGPPPGLAATLLAECGDGAWEMTGWGAELVQYRVDMRAILRLSIQAQRQDGQRAEGRSFAKIYRDGKDGIRAAEAQRAVSARAAEEGGVLSAAPVTAYLDSMQTLVTEALPGTSLSKIVRRGEDVIPAVRAAARAVAEFHQLDVPAAPRPASVEMSQLLDAADYLNTARPDLAPSIEATTHAIAAGLEHVPMGLIHGDLKPDHILIDGDRVSLIDFDLMAKADPILDVAHLVAFLGKPQERARLRRGAQPDIADEFLDEYFTHVPPAWRRRLSVYHAITAIHKAVGLSRRRGADGQDRLEDVLREAESLLEGERGDAVPTFKRRMTRTSTRAH